MNRSMNYENALNRYPIEKINEAVEDLKYGRKLYPDFKTSLNDDSRFTRHNAIDFFLYLSAGKPELIDSDILVELHKSLFDNDAAVRLATVRTLGILGKQESLTALQELQNIEVEDDWVKMALKEAIRAINGTLDLSGAKFIKDPSSL